MENIAGALSTDAGYATVSTIRRRSAAELKSADEPHLEHDSSTNALIQRYRRFKK